MPTVLQLRRGTTAEHSTFTGAEGEVTVNTSKDTIVVHDGSTQGGFEVALADATNLSGVDVSNFDAAAIQTGSEAFSDSDTVLMTAAAVQDKIESYSYQATITGAATTIDTENLTASRALVSDGSGKVAVSAVTSTEIGYLDGVTSAIQTQIDNNRIDIYDSTGTLLN